MSSLRRAVLGFGADSFGWLSSAGLLCIVVGTFLPWLRSGEHSRNSFAADGAARRLLGIGGVGGAALAAWPLVVLACALAVAAQLVRWSRTAAIIALLAAAGAVAGAVAMLTAGHSAVMRPAFGGPIVTLVGAFLVVAAVTMQRLIFRRTA